MLRRLGWPIGFIASMAGREFNSFFASIKKGAHGDSDYCLNVLRGLTIAKECQHLRRTATPQGGLLERSTYDWFDA